ncbi:MAG: hypothetical protein ACXVOH_09360 [Bacteroidia bacterium]
MKKSLPELKDKTRILMIDDEETSLVDSLKSEGWHIKYLPDLDRYNNTDLKDAHIVCVDIKGVGKKLNIKEEGLGLVRNIKEKYPEKRIILCSSVSSHDIFDNAIDLVDKKVYKDGQTHPFDSAIEELSYKIFDWDSLIREIYFKYKTDFGIEISLEDFNDKMKSAINGNEVDVEKILKITAAGMKVASGIKTLLLPFVT